LSGSSENALDHIDGNAINAGDWAAVIPYSTQARMRRELRLRDLGHYPRLGVGWRSGFLVTGRRRQQRLQHTGFMCRLVD
jgi:hypothetical protein